MTADRDEGAWVKPKKVDLEDPFSRFDDLWSPKSIGTVKDHDLKLVKVRDGLVWHQHDDTDAWLRAGSW